jgi:O-antigen ligase
LISTDFVQSTLEQAEMGLHSDWAVGDWTTGGEDEENLEEGDVTSLVRILLWSYSIRKLIASPVFGLGWGRFNDTNLVLVGVPGIIDFAADGEQRLSTSNAHNSYFHVLAESGLLGLFLLLALWIILYRRFGRACRLLNDFAELRAYFVACQGLIVFALSCSLTGHALASPSIMIPVLTMLGAGIAFLRTNVKRVAKDKCGDRADAAQTDT